MSTNRPSVVAPDICLICYGNVSSKKRIKNEDPEKRGRSMYEEEGSCGTDVVFILKVLLLVPESLLECLPEKTDKPPTQWFSLCDICFEKIEQARLVYEKMLELYKRFRNTQEEIIKKIKESYCGNFEDSILCSQEDKREKDFVESFMITDICRKVVRERALDSITEKPVVVEDIKEFTKRLFPYLPRENHVTSEKPTLTNHQLPPPVSLIDLDLFDEKISSETECDSSLHAAYMKNSYNKFESTVSDETSKDGGDISYSDGGEHPSESEDEQNSSNTSKQTITKGSSNCFKCNKTFSTVRGLQLHIRRAHRKNERITNDKGIIKDKKAIAENQFSCHHEGCGRVFTSGLKLQMHVSRHGEKPSFKCCNCSKAYFTEDKLDKHKQLAHFGSFKCQFCGKMFGGKRNLYWHETRNCKLRKGKKGEEGGKSENEKRKGVKNMGKDMENLASLEHFQEDNLVQCYICGKQYKSQSILNGHLRFIHRGELKFKCKICGEKMRHMYQLREHMAEKHDINVTVYQCSVPGCRMKFREKAKLEHHTAKEHGESGTETRFQCKYCGKRFHQKHPLTQHEMLHENQETKPFKCDLCGKGFANTHNLRSHQLYTHRVEKKVEVRKETKPRSYVQKKVAWNRK